MHSNSTESPDAIVSVSDRVRTALPLALIMLVAAALRLYHLGHWSLWYDEVVTMRLARAGSPRAMLDLLGQIDATRAPLHPLLLMAWTHLFGPSDFAARALSACLGIATVLAVYSLARAAFNTATARWSAWLCAVCPTLVYFSQEVRMYSLLVLLTVISWDLFLRFRASASGTLAAAYVPTLAAIAYTHPLGLFMIAAHALAYALTHRRLALDSIRWLAAMIVLALLINPWVRRYFDHSPDYPLPRYPLKYLLAVPIEYIGGNSLTLLPLAALILFGLFTRRNARITLREPTEAAILLTWFLVPIIALYTYSHIGHPIFGPSRYNLFVAPAYLILVARGLAALPRSARFIAATLMLALSLQQLAAVTYAPGVKADWRAFSRWLAAQGDTHPSVVVVPHDPLFPRTQFEAALYYLEPSAEVHLDPAGTPAALTTASTYRVHCFRAPDWQPPTGESIALRLYGLTVTRPAPHPPPPAL